MGRARQSFIKVHPSLMAQTCVTPRAHRTQIKSRHEKRNTRSCRPPCHPQTCLSVHDHRYLLVTMTDRREKACLWLCGSGPIPHWTQHSGQLAPPHICYEVVWMGRPPPLPPSVGRAGLKGMISPCTSPLKQCNWPRWRRRTARAGPAPPKLSLRRAGPAEQLSHHPGPGPGF